MYSVSVATTPLPASKRLPMEDAGGEFSSCSILLFYFRLPLFNSKFSSLTVPSACRTQPQRESSTGTLYKEQMPIKSLHLCRSKFLQCMHFLFVFSMLFWFPVIRIFDNIKFSHTVDMITAQSTFSRQERTALGFSCYTFFDKAAIMKLVLYFPYDYTFLPTGNIFYVAS